MYRDRLEQTPVKSAAAKRLQRALIKYHDFQLNIRQNSDSELTSKLSEWQIKRLIHTHNDLYTSGRYRQGLEFLFSDLYAAKDFSARDNDLERIFPKLIKLMPDKILNTVATLVELNLLTQTLDQKLARQFQSNCETQELNADTYSEAFRTATSQTDREHQLEQVEEVGRLLDKYARSSTILFSLKITKSPAEMAGLGALHDFILRGFQSFHNMADIPYLMKTVVDRERALFESVFNGGIFEL